MKDKQRISYYYLLVLLIVSILIFPSVSWPAYKTSLSNTHIQSATARHFPIRDYAAFVKITLNEPQIVLTKEAKDIFLVIPVDANILDKPEKQGHARISVGVAYNQGNGGLYLVNPRVIEFDMPEISTQLSKDLKAKIAAICLNSLPLIHIYKLSEKNLQHSLAKSTLKSYFIKDDTLDLEFGFD